MNIDKKLLGYRIKDIRLKQKLNMEQFADKIKDVTNNASNPGKSNVSRWERGENIPNDITLEAIAKLGSITVDELLYGNENEILKRNIIEIGKNNEYDLLDTFIVYLNKHNKTFSDFYTNKSYTYGSFKPANSAEHEEMKKIIASELFQSFIENIDLQTIKDKTQQHFFFSEDDNSLKREIAFMMNKYFDLIMFEDDNSIEGKIMNAINILKYDFPYTVVEYSNLDDYISNSKENKLDSISEQIAIETAIELFFSKEAYNIATPFRQELANLLDDYEKAKDNYLNNDNQ